MVISVAELTFFCVLVKLFNTLIGGRTPSRKKKGRKERKKRKNSQLATGHAEHH